MPDGQSVQGGGQKGTVSVPQGCHHIGQDGIRLSLGPKQPPRLGHVVIEGLGPLCLQRKGLTLIVGRPVANLRALAIRTRDLKYW